ncbi:hypothetical protein BJX76DRAFT_350001 [Aspergillus varians]
MYTLVRLRLRSSAETGFLVIILCFPLRPFSCIGPLSSSRLPCTFPASRLSILMNHPLPFKPPISMHFNAYTSSVRKPVTMLNDIDHDKSNPVNNNWERLFVHYCAATSFNRLLTYKASSIHPVKVCTGPPLFPAPGSYLSVMLLLPDMITRLVNDHDKASNINTNTNDDLPHSNESFSCIWNCNDAGSCEASATLRVDNGLDLNETCLTTSKVRGIDLSCERHHDDANDHIAIKYLSDGSKGGMPGTLGSKGLIPACLNLPVKG